MNECIFCKIVNGERKANIIYEDELVLGFMDINPINEGHILLIPKQHKLDLDELTTEESNRIMEVSKLMVKVLKNKYPLDGYSMMQNGGAFNDIGHYHLHIFPRYKNDGFGWNFGKVKNMDLKKVGQEIASEINRV